MSEIFHVVCPSCATMNRVPQDRVYDSPYCGRCKSPLFSGKPVDLDAVNFEAHIHRTDLPVVVDFWAPWCSPCLAMAPVFANAAQELEPRVRFARLNTEADPALAARFNIRSIPTLIAFRDGFEVARQSGVMPSSALIRWISQHALPPKSPYPPPDPEPGY